MGETGRGRAEHDSSNDGAFDVAIVGGGAAGLSAALTLGRALRRVIVIDAGAPRNAPAAHMHGYLGHDGLPPGELLERGRKEIASYSVTLVEGEAVSAVLTGDIDAMSFDIVLADQRKVTSRRLLLSSGSRDHLPEIPGLQEAWGEDVHICPYCHGYEVRNQPLAVIATGEHSAPYTLMIRNWSHDVILFAHEHGPFGMDQLEQFEAMGIRVVEGKIRRLVIEAGRVQGIEMESGEQFARSAIFLGTYQEAHLGLAESLGADIVQTPQGPMVGVDPQGRTCVPGVWAAGNITNSSLQVVGAAAAGNLAGGGINMDLILEDVNRRVADLRDNLQKATGGSGYV
jgi:thioredoxin reductase